MKLLSKNIFSISKNKIRGFTLIELLVVISIIGLLSGIVLAAVNTARDKASVAAGLQFSSHNYHTIGDDMALYWNFNETSGGVTDYSGNGFTGTLGASVTRSSDTPTNNGSSVSFAGTGGVANLITATNSSSPSLTNYTASLWIKPTNLSGTQSLLRINGTGTFGVYLFANIIKMHRADATTSSCGTAVVYTYTTNTAVKAGVWQNITVSYDGTYFNVYLNGKFMEKSPISCTGFPSLSVSPVNLGAFPNGTADLYTGLMDDVVIYRTSLLSSEINDIYVRGLPKHLLADSK